MGHQSPRVFPKVSYLTCLSISGRKAGFLTVKKVKLAASKRHINRTEEVSWTVGATHDFRSRNRQFSSFTLANHRTLRQACLTCIHQEQHRLVRKELHRLARLERGSWALQQRRSRHHIRWHSCCGAGVADAASADAASADAASASADGACGFRSLRCSLRRSRCLHTQPERCMMARRELHMKAQRAHQHHRTQLERHMWARRELHMKAQHARQHHRTQLERGSLDQPELHSSAQRCIHSLCRT